MCQEQAQYPCSRIELEKYDNIIVLCYFKKKKKNILWFVEGLMKSIWDIVLNVIKATNTTEIQYYSTPLIHEFIALLAELTASSYCWGMEWDTQLHSNMLFHRICIFWGFTAFLYNANKPKLT